MAIYEPMTVTGQDARAFQDAHTFVALPPGQNLKDHMDAIEMISANPGRNIHSLVAAFRDGKRREYSRYAVTDRAAIPQLGGGDPEW